MLSEKGFNEYDNKLFEHLLHNKKPCSFVRTMCDNIIDQEDDSDSESDTTISLDDKLLLFGQLIENTQKYIEENVLRAHKIDFLGNISYIIICII